MPGVSGVPVVTTVCTLLSHTGCGCHEHPAFPAPSWGRAAPSLEGRPRALRFQRPHVSTQNSRVTRGENAELYLPRVRGPAVVPTPNDGDHVNRFLNTDRMQTCGDRPQIALPQLRLYYFALQQNGHC